MPPKNQKISRVQSSKGASNTGKRDGDLTPEKAERRVQILERENMMLRKNLNMSEIMKDFKRSFAESDMQQMFFESLHELQQKLLQYESGIGAPVSGSLSDLQKDVEKEREKVKSLERDVNEKNKMINEKDKELKGIKTELELQNAHARHSAEAVKKLQKLEMEYAELKKKIFIHETTIKQQSDEITRLKKELAEYEKSTMTMQEEMSEIEKLRSELRESVKKQEEQTRDIQELKRDLGKSDRKFRETEAILKAKEKTLEQRNEVIKKLNEEKQSMDKNDEGKADKLSEMIKCVENHEKTIQRLSDEKLEKEKKLHDLRTTLDENDKTIKSLEVEKQRMLDENVGKDTELSELRAKQISNEKLIAELKENAGSTDKRADTSEVLREKIEEINRLKDELAQAKRSNERIKAEKEKLEFTCHEAFDKLTQKEKLSKQMEEEYKKKIERKDDTIQKLRREMTLVDPTAGGSVKVETKSLVDKYEKAEKELKLAKDEIHELKNRLSKVVGANVVNGNPDITDLSDANRPTRLSEKFSQLYDNEWTDAYEEAGKERKTEEQTISYLYQTVEDVFDFCKTIAEEHAKSIQASVLTVPYAANGRPKSAKIDGAKLRQLKELRRSFAPYLADSVFHHFVNTLKLNLTGKKKTELFIKRCIEVCWLMNVQDPPVIFDNANEKGKEFDGDRFRSYTRSGKTVDFVVWPPMLLHKNGPLLCKGVAQGK